MEKFKILLLFLCLQWFCFPHTTIAQGVNITSGGSISVTGTASIVINNGDFVNNGTFIKDSETVTFSGNTARFILGTSNTDLNNLFITNTSGITTQLNQLTINNLTIASDCKFSIDPTTAVEVSGAINNNASTNGFILKSDATGTASLIHNTNDVPATVQRYVSGNAEDWHFISSPVSTQSISGSWLPSGTYGNGTGYDLYLWNEPNSCWIYKLNTTSTINWNTVHSENNFDVGRGYLYSVQETTPTKEFAGNLNNGTVNVSLSYASDTLSLKGFNLIGNPFPSSMDWKAPTGWTRTNLKNSGGGYNIWIWNPAVNNYGVYNSANIEDGGTNSVSRYIAATQSFFVQANNTGNLSMTNSVRILDGSNNWFKNSPVDYNKLSVCIKSDAGLGSDEIRMNFGYHENEKGALKLFSTVLSAPGIYIPYFSENLSILNLTDTEENPVVPINFAPGANGDYTINCNFDSNKFEIVMLEDRKIGYIQDMKNKNSYSFKADKTDSKNRFVMHFGAVDGNFSKQLPARIYSNGASLIIDLLLVTKETSVTVCDIMGRILLKDNYIGKTRHTISINAKTQIIIVYLENTDGSLCQKIFWGKY